MPASAVQARQHATRAALGYGSRLPVNLAPPPPPPPQVRSLMVKLHASPSPTLSELLLLLGQPSTSADNVSVFELLNSGEG